MIEQDVLKRDPSMCLRKSLSVLHWQGRRSTPSETELLRSTDSSLDADAALHSKLSGSLQGHLSAPEAGPAGQSAQPLLKSSCFTAEAWD